MLQNPVLYKDMKDLAGVGATVEGVAWKTFFFLLFALAAAYGSWNNPDMYLAHSGLLAFATLGIGLAASYLPDFTMLLGPLYAVLEGTFIGTYSLMMEEMYPGIVIQAVSCTFGIGISAAFLYANGLVKVTSTFRKVVSILTLGIVFIYIVDVLVFFLFGLRVPLLNENSFYGILVSLVILGIATAHLFLDFERVNTAVKMNMDARYEYYLAFGLTVTLIWLYLEVLRLLGKGRSRK